ncbi:hypothetical protein GPL15_13755 [Clostridium sp. MCC353]|uniref:hypothetical protein n=1 Tax=Clostridium sp. MCC353 TaxID=2592646 RepID=UPI001C024487|nr:hypothetical protein [Clostridium sp. MCC353]MBT9777567.1 hypothetical protein [Clostridium sp. MCC353]
MRIKRYAVLLVGILGVVLLTLIYSGQEKHVEPVTEAETEPRTAAPPETQPVSMISDEERSLLILLEEHLKNTDLPAAAALLNDNEQAFRDLYYTAMGGKPYFFDGQETGFEAKGEGICFQSYSTVFFGNFGEEGLDGPGLALQAIRLDHPRYDYSAGNWEHGLLNGKGIIGYSYYEGINEEEAREIKKEGTFVRDLMDGPVTYTSVNAKGVETVWKFTAENGVTVMDDKWQYDPDKKEYHLPSELDGSRIYMQEESSLQEVRWKNMIPWK